MHPRHTTNCELKLDENEEKPFQSHLLSVVLDRMAGSALGLGESCRHHDVMVPVRSSSS